MPKPIYSIILVLTCLRGWGQTCCSGGVPLSSNLGLPAAAKNTFQASLGYDFNLLNTLQDGTDKLDDNSRRRTTHTLMAQFGYTFTSKVSVNFLVPFVRQEREITPSDRPSSFDYSQGIGDAVLLAKYQFIPNYQVGLGLKFPTGSTTEVNSQGVTLNADMQPGSGSWDLIYWFMGNQPLDFRPSATIGLVATYRSTGENPEYFGSQVYDFGNEFQSTLTFSDQLLVGSIILNPGLGFKFRTVEEDKNDGTVVPSTGGTWWFLRPSLGIPLFQYAEIQSTLDIPIYANLVGTQVTPTMRINLALLVTFSPKNNSSL